MTFPPSWRTIQLLHGALMLIATIVLIASTNHDMRIASGFVLGFSSSAIGYIQMVMNLQERTHKLIELAELMMSDKATVIRIDIGDGSRDVAKPTLN